MSILTGQIETLYLQDTSGCTPPTCIDNIPMSFEAEPKQEHQNTEGEAVYIGG